MFIRLQDKDYERDLFVNVDRVNYFNSLDKGGTFIDHDRSGHCVKETPEEILALIDKAKSKDACEAWGVKDV